VLVCTHATFRFAVDAYGVAAFDDRLIAVDEFHHVSSNPDNKLGQHLGQFIARGRTHIVAMTGSYPGFANWSDELTIFGWYWCVSVCEAGVDFSKGRVGPTYPLCKVSVGR